MTPSRGWFTRHAPGTGPYSSAEYDAELGGWFVRLNGPGRAALEAWLAGHPDPVGILARYAPRHYGGLRRLGYTREEITSVCLYGLVKAFVRYDPARGAELVTALIWGVKGAATEVLWHARDWRREFPASDVWVRDRDHGDGEPAARETPTPDPDLGETVGRLLDAAGLTESDRAVVDAVYFGGQSLVGYARESGTTRGRAKQIKHRALERLRRAAKREGVRDE